ncbi:MAG: aldolase [Hyphomicrobiaceae bacterium]
MPDATSPPVAATVHATGIAVMGAGALIVGPSGAGKSDLALRCLTQAFTDGERLLPVRLVGDDQVHLRRQGSRVSASAPASIAGLIEVRHVGIVRVDHVAQSDICIVVDVTPGQPLERMPDGGITYPLLGVELPCIRLAATEASAPAKVILALLDCCRGREQRDARDGAE